MGGRGSGKSESALRVALIKGMEKPLTILCCREIQSSLTDSVHRVLENIIDIHNLRGFYEVQKSTIIGKNGTEFLFAGLRHNVSSIKSKAGINICIVEEADSVSDHSWKTLIPTIREPNSEIWVIFNPQLDSDVTYQRFVAQPPKDIISITANWRQNPFFPSVLKDEMRDLEIKDYAEYLHVYEGHCKQAVDGAVFINEIAVMDLEQRITNVAYDPVKPVHCVWDLGFGDHTSIWFFQFIGMEIRLIRFYQNRLKGPDHYLAEIQKHGYVLGTMYLPHDAKASTLAANGRSMETIVRNAGHDTRVLTRFSITDRLSAARSIFPKCWIDKSNCIDGIVALRRYRFKIDPDTRQYSKEPLHDEYSDAADAFSYLAVAIKEKKEKVKSAPQFNDAGWMA